MILLVEDDDDHVLIAKRILRDLGFPTTLEVVRDGKEALDRLTKKPELPVPQLILLDLNLPRMGGKELLKHIKADSSLKEIPVVMLSSSDRQEDMLLVKQLGAAGYISKSAGFDKLSKDFGGLRRFMAPHDSPAD